jgi:hypothetical protein
MRPMRPFPCLVLVACGSLAACGSTTTSTEPAAAGSVSRSEASSAARDVMVEAYSSLRRGDVDGFQALATPDVFVVGPGAGDVLVSRTDAVVALSTGLASGSANKKHKVTSRALQVTASPGRKSAWAVDRIDFDGAPYHVTAILVESDEIWQIAAVHVGHAGGIPDKKPPKAAALPGGVGPGAEDVAARFKEAMANPERVLDQLSDRKEVIIVGTSAKDISRGLKAIKKSWKKKVKRNPKMAVIGEVRAGVTPDGTLGWVLANVDVEDDAIEKLHHRYALVYERDGPQWRLLSVHASLGSR